MEVGGTSLRSVVLTDSMTSDPHGEMVLPFSQRW